MGLDGGTVPTRSDLLRRSSWRLTNSDLKNRSSRGGSLRNHSSAHVVTAAELVEDARLKLCTCALCGDPLVQPTVACTLGFLYSPECVRQYVLGLGRFQYCKAELPQFSHLKSVDSVYPVNVVESLCSASAAPAVASRPGVPGVCVDAPFLSCPISGVPANGRHDFGLVTECGHVVSMKAIRAVKASTCLVCDGPYQPHHLIKLAPSQESLDKLKMAQQELDLAPRPAPLLAICAAPREGPGSASDSRAQSASAASSSSSASSSLSTSSASSASSTLPGNGTAAAQKSDTAMSSRSGHAAEPAASGKRSSSHESALLVRESDSSTSSAARECSNPQPSVQGTSTLPATTDSPVGAHPLPAKKRKTDTASAATTQQAAAAPPKASAPEKPHPGSGKKSASVGKKSMSEAEKANLLKSMGGTWLQ